MQSSSVATFENSNGFKKSTSQAVSVRGSGKSTTGEGLLWGHRQSLNGKVVMGNARKSQIDKRVFLLAKSSQY